MEFRQADFGDLDAIMAVIEDGRAALAALGIDQWQGGNPTVGEIRDDLAMRRTYVAVEDGTVAGTLAFVVGEPDYDRLIDGAWLVPSPNCPGDGPARYAALHRLAVAAAARRRGVASFMLASACALARERGLASVRADTHEGNGPMQATFEACGMVRCCKIDITHPMEPTKLRVGYELALETPSSQASDPPR